MSGEPLVYTVGDNGDGKVANGKVALLNSSGVAVFQSGKFNLGGDLFIYFTAGAPVDYTDGSPPATGEAEASIGSLCVRLDTGKWYTNKGTKAQPIWGIVTSA